MEDLVSKLTYMNLPCITEIDQHNLLKSIKLEELNKAAGFRFSGSSAPGRDDYHENL